MTPLAWTVFVAFLAWVVWDGLRRSSSSANLEDWTGCTFPAGFFTGPQTGYTFSGVYFKNKFVLLVRLSSSTLSKGAWSYT